MRNLLLICMVEGSKQFNMRKCCLLIQSFQIKAITKNHLLLDSFAYRDITGLSEK